MEDIVRKLAKEYNGKFASNRSSSLGDFMLQVRYDEDTYKIVFHHQDVKVDVFISMGRQTLASISSILPRYAHKHPFELYTKSPLIRLFWRKSCPLIEKGDRSYVLKALQKTTEINSIYGAY